jgi:uncharacterized iron-regulated membrane protein
MRFDHPRGLRQSMSWLHTWSGLVLGWLLFAVYVTGALAFFRNEITFWMQPELHKADSRSLALGRALQILQREAADAPQWTLTLPGPRNPTLGLSWQTAAAGGRGEGRPQEGGRPQERAGENGQGTRNAERVGEGRQNAPGAAPNRAPREGDAREGRRNATDGRQGEGASVERPARGGEGRPEGRRRGGEGAGSVEGAEGAGGATFNRIARNGDNPEAQGGERGAPAALRQGPQNASRQAQGAQGGGGGGGGRGPRILLDPATGEVLQGRETAGGNFLYRFHFELYGMDRIWARWIVGIATLFMFAAIISGVIVHRNIFKDFFTFRPAKGKRSWLDAHNASSVMSLPFHIVITFSGLLLFGNMLIPTAMQSAYRGDTDAYMQDVRARFMAQAPAQPSGEAAPLTDLALLVAAAEQAWEGRAAGSITITNPGDSKAVVEIRQSMTGGSLADGRGMAESLRFDGVSGVALEAPDAAPVSAVQSISNTLIMLHRGFFASPIARWLLFLSGIGGALMIATGLVMWVTARAKDRERASRAARFGQRLVEVLNVAGIAGLLVAIGAYFWANRLVPADLAGRNTLEIQAFFYAWLAALAYALIRRHKAAWIEELAGAGLLIALLPFVNALTGGLSLFGSVYLDQWILAGFDLTALLIGAGLLFAARKVYLHTPRVRAGKTAPEETADAEATVASIAPVAPEASPATHEDHAGEPLLSPFAPSPAGEAA